MIGFDIVDLQFANRSKHQHHPRFNRKIFSERELNDFSSYLVDSTLLWVMWAMKESAYKAIPNNIQQDFKPSKFHLQQFSENENHYEGRVEHNGQIFHCRSELKNNMLSCVAVYDPSKFDKVKHDILKLESESVDLARQLLKDSIHLFLNNMKLDQYQLQHLASGKPVIAHSNEIRENISISHHGHYAGFAYLPK